ncbi:thrombospondin type 3 repeat-containing protein [Zooshikella ganghwensis]|uniref:Uncharacterized protein n=1 Tax=Zooshikella ganghwensis TaxID=202772 RepID=A0A4P9VH06_9GAMM|nr:thrombospondin type 3 repeat-containing protein [Zooshikella ganghwensis]RDH41397.1 hypothetical protein B9G39_28480 [Zooshikella ganghwensis]
MRTGKVGVQQHSIIETEIYSSGGLLSFDFATSSYDYVKFFINGEVKIQQWQEKPYKRFEFLLPAGRHKLRWAFGRVEGGTRGQDAGWVDNLFIPALPDADNDGVKDGWEYHYFKTLDRDLYQDFDEDGITDFDEYQAGSDPTNALNAQTH